MTTSMTFFKCGKMARRKTHSPDFDIIGTLVRASKPSCILARSGYLDGTTVDMGEARVVLSYETRCDLGWLGVGRQILRWARHHGMLDEDVREKWWVENIYRITGNFGMSEYLEHRLSVASDFGINRIETESMPDVLKRVSVRCPDASAASAISSPGQGHMRSLHASK
jgi:hypothetical protein